MCVSVSMCDEYNMNKRECLSEYACVCEISM